MAPAELTMPQPDDWHVHLRDDDMLSAVVQYSARRYRHAIVMPNLRPPISSTADAEQYRQRILDRLPAGSTFDPWMTLFASADLDLADLRAGAEAGIVRAVKFYPAGATTNSDQAAGSLASMGPLLETLSELKMRLLVHAESTDPTVDIFDREAAFLDRQLAPVTEDHPELLVTVEHVSTCAGIEFVQDIPNTAASITPHHLARHRNDLLAHGMEPDLFCKPVINTAADQQALIAAATSGDRRFFLGTDSAPHPTTAKYRSPVAAGIFNAPYGLEVTAEVFHQAGRLDRLAAFAAFNGAAVYGVEPATTQITLTRSDEPVDGAETILTTESGDDVIFFGADEARFWTIS